jgi:hypothetical protein
VDGKLYFKSLGWVEMPERMSIDEFKKINRGRSSQQRGEAGEMLVRAELEALGLAMIEKINNGWQVIRTGRKITGAYPLAKVSGDFIAIIPGSGRKVLAESKWRDQSKLKYSDIEQHQRDALYENMEMGGLSLVAWVNEGIVKVFRWPYDGFTSGTSLDWVGLHSISKDDIRR